jgi:hypothetical protein
LQRDERIPESIGLAALQYRQEASAGHKSIHTGTCACAFRRWRFRLHIQQCASSDAATAAVLVACV